VCTAVKAGIYRFSLSTRGNPADRETQTAQHVEMQMEHHGKAIVVFTVVTIVFLPMSFVASVFGMNVKDIREMESGQWMFWGAASAMTVVVVGLSLVVAFLGEKIVKAFKTRFSGDEKHVR